MQHTTHCERLDEDMTKSDLAMTIIACFSTNLFRNVESFCPIWMFPVAAVSLTEDRIVRFFEAFRFFVESGQIPFHDGFHPVKRFILFDSSVDTKMNVL